MLNKKISTMKYNTLTSPTSNLSVLNINVTNSLQLKEPLTTKHLNFLLQNINDIGFASTTQLLLLNFTEEASVWPSNTYKNSLLLEMFSLTKAHEQDLAQSKPSTFSLKMMILVNQPHH